MIDVRVAFDDNRLDDRLRVFGADARKVLHKVLRTTGNAYRKHMRNNYLKGQMLGRRTKKTYKSVKVKKVRGESAYQVIPYLPIASIYEHAGGAVIKPKNAKVLRWVNQEGEWRSAHEVRLRERPFVTASFKSFPWGFELDKAANKVIKKELARRFGGGR